ncbi:hypothetical protein V5O48_011517 [Marasmius crinis-equi]|uniref:Uncharacterized protein n=1 Tax=Marasmius crinis-equi TaxID=585013 RepID=A0ABR3F5E8_9AGAR
MNAFYQFLLPDESRTAPHGSRLKLYPFSLILVGLWAAFIVLLVWWMETVVRRGPGMVGPDNHTLPWNMATLPGILLTVFSQAHVPITGIHLARAAVSALQYPGSSPNSWLELFWLADQEWLGPVGIIKATWKSIRSRSRASVTFILFATTSAVALITPVLMAQAYAKNNVDLRFGYNNLMIADVISFTRLRFVDGSVQRTMGLLSWLIDSVPAITTDLSIIYHPADAGFFSGELFITGSTSNGMIVPNLPGLFLNMSCSPVSSSDLDTSDLNMSWPSFCQSHIPQFSGLIPGQGLTGGAKDFDEFSLYLCNNQTGTTFPFIDRDQTQSRNVGYLYYTYTSFRDNNTRNTSGLIQCDSTLTTGIATVDGNTRNWHTYTNFSPQQFLDTGGTATVPLLDPLFATFNSFVAWPTADPRASVFEGIDLGPSVVPASDFADHVSERVRSNLQNGALTFTTALARLCRTSELHPVQLSASYALYTRNKTYATCAYLSLVAWAVLIGVITLRSWRRTFSSSLNSYVAAELVFRERHLLEGVSIGEADDNEALREARFVFPSGDAPIGEMAHTEMSKKTTIGFQDRPLLKNVGLAGASNNDSERSKGPLSLDCSG